MIETVAQLHRIEKEPVDLTVVPFGLITIAVLGYLIVRHFLMLVAIEQLAGTALLGIGRATAPVLIREIERLHQPALSNLKPELPYARDREQDAGT